MKPLLFIVVLIVTEPLLQLGAAEVADKSSGIESALVVLTGNDSHISTAAFHRVESAVEWKKTWLDHLGMKEDTIYRPAMEIDFDRCVVIAVLGGKSANSCGYRIESVRENEKTIVVHFDEIWYQTAGPDGGADRVTPYAFIVLPKSRKPVVLEKNMQILKGQAPDWKEVARLDRS